MARIAGAVFAVLAFGAALMFSVVFFAILALAALVFWGWWRWKTRALRQMMREQAEKFESAFDGMQKTAPKNANVIEGEAVRVDEERGRLERNR
jgi:Flp pilus assembly protein TadB